MGVVALLVTKWVHSVELSTLNGVQPSARERELFTHIQEVLQEAEYDLGESTSLAAGVATTWGWFLQDVSKPHPISGSALPAPLTASGAVKVWIWGITPRMGSALGLLAKAYERVRMANRRHSIDAGR